MPNGTLKEGKKKTRAHEHGNVIPLTLEGWTKRLTENGSLIRDRGSRCSGHGIHSSTGNPAPSPEDEYADTQAGQDF